MKLGWGRKAPTRDLGWPTWGGKEPRPGPRGGLGERDPSAVSLGRKVRPGLCPVSVVTRHAWHAGSRGGWSADPGGRGQGRGSSRAEGAVGRGRSPMGACEGCVALGLLLGAVGEGRASLGLESSVRQLGVQHSPGGW